MTRPAIHLIDGVEVNDGPVSTPQTRGHVTAAVVNAYSSRGSHQPGGPVLHASAYPPVPASPSGNAYLAKCSAKVRNVTRVAWDPHGPGRRCEHCQRLESPPAEA